MPFEFVNNAAIDRNARKLIRSHVAKGRNVGKIRSSRRKQSSPVVKIPKSICSTRDVGDAQDAGKDKAIHEIERQVGDGLSVLSFPTQLTPRSRGLVQKGTAISNCAVDWNNFVDRQAVFSFISGPLYPPELGNAIDSAGAASMWIQYMFLDEACMSFSRFSLLSPTLLILNRFSLLCCDDRRGCQSSSCKARRRYRSNASPFGHLSPGQRKALGK